MSAIRLMSFKPRLTKKIMKNSEIASRLCYYDTRNPDGVKDMGEEAIKELGYTTTSKPNCSCDNCFYGRTKLAEYILKLKEAMSPGIHIPLAD